MQNIPKVKFVLPTAKQEAEYLFYFLIPNASGWDWSKSIYKEHPKLKIRLQNVKNKKDILKECYKYTKEFIKNNQQELKLVQVKYQKEWSKVGDKYLKILSSLFETKWPKNKIIKANISINPICPRILDSWSFNVRYNKPQYLLPTAFHEILHFIYFKKLKEVFPKVNKKHFDAPYLIWRLSEIIDPIILNNTPEIRKMLKRPTQGYEEFKKIKIKGVYINMYFTKMYQKHLQNKKSFKFFLKELYRIGKNNEKIINKV